MENVIEKKPLTTIVREVLKLPSSKTIFNDITSKNRRRFKVWGWDRTDELTKLEFDELNKQFIYQGWRIFEHGIWKSNGYRSKDYVIRVEKLSQSEIIASFITVVDFNFLSDYGIIYKINKEILHPLGLALSREEDGTSKGCILAPDLIWEYDDDAHQRNEKKFEDFSKNRKEILLQKLKESV